MEKAGSVLVQADRMYLGEEGLTQARGPPGQARTVELGGIFVLELLGCVFRDQDLESWQPLERASVF